jgi:SPP1 gp7 family putative phage head morphogenesis protein
VAKKKSFQPPQVVENQYRRGLDNILLRYLKFSPKDSISSILDRLTHLANAEFIRDYARMLSSRMITHVRASNARSWQQAAAQAGMGREIYEALQEELQSSVGQRVRNLIDENARLISSVPSQVATSLNREIANLQQRGLRPEAIAAHIRQRAPQLTKSRIALIARTETSKASTALTQARSESVGIPAYEWETSQDQRVRTSHKKMQGVIVFWNDPPSPEALIGENSSLGHYHAGNCPNCRCDALPIISLNTISWPARVYWNGRIEHMTHSVFEKRSGISSQRAA